QHLGHLPAFLGDALPAQQLGNLFGRRIGVLHDQLADERTFAARIIRDGAQELFVPEMLGTTGSISVKCRTKPIQRFCVSTISAVTSFDQRPATSRRCALAGRCMAASTSDLRARTLERPALIWPRRPESSGKS